MVPVPGSRDRGTHQLEPADWDNQTNATANINAGATAGCDGSGTLLKGHDDWSNVLYRSSASIHFAGSIDIPDEMTSDDEVAFYQARDVDGNGAGDGTDCGGIVNVDAAPPPSPARTAWTLLRASSELATGDRDLQREDERLTGVERAGPGPDR